MAFYDEEAASEQTSHLIRNTLRRLRRWHRGSPRQQLAAISCWVFLLYLALRASKNFTLSSSLSPATLISCKSLRDRVSQSVMIPKPPDKKILAQTWQSLQSSFDQNKPQPLDLNLVTFESLTAFPPLEDIQSHTHLEKVDADATRRSHIEVVKNIPPYPEGLYKGRGIVILAGGRFSPFAETGMGMLREIGSTLPVEIWMKDKAEEKAGWCKDILQDGMVCRRLSDYMDTSKMESGYQLKVNSILFSSFEQILFLDADNVPVKNPDAIFDAQTFTETGVILWPDYWKHSGAPLLPYEVGLSDTASELFREDQTAESGQLVWDKKRHWKALCLAAYYNYYGPQHYYTLISQGWAGWGDKDTFPIALRAMRENFHMVPHQLRTLFVNGTTSGIGMLQGDPTNNDVYMPMFLHSNMIKWSIRNFLCLGCSSDRDDPVPMSFLEKPDSPINPHLKQHSRIFKLDEMHYMGIDPEPLIWKAMEHTACRSVWKDDGLCLRTRAHMTQTFGHQFGPPGVMAGFLGYGDRVCIKEQ